MAGKVTRKRGAPLSLREQALVSIKKGILESLYPPGSLLSEGQLAEELRISRTPIREAMRELAAGRLHSRVPATILIALGAFFPTITDSLNRAGSTELFQLGKFLGVVFLFAGFLVSVEVFREIRVPFTSIRIGRTRSEPAGAEQLAAASETAGDHPTAEHAPS